MKTNADLKQEAKQLLSGHRWQAFLLNLVAPLLTYLFIYIGILMITVLIISELVTYQYQLSETSFDYTLVSFLIFLIASFGVIFATMCLPIVTMGVANSNLLWYRHRDTREIAFAKAFRYLDKAEFRRAFSLIFKQTLYLFLWGLIPLVGPIIALVKQLSYSQTYYIYLVHKELGTDDILTKSRQLMQGHKWELFCLYLSFIGWYLLVFITAGLASFWVVPYTNTTAAIYYENLKVNA